MVDNFREYVGTLIEKHVSTCFVDSEYLENVIDALCKKQTLNRKEVLMLAYIIGANGEETDELLKYMGHHTLYVKRREDAIWKFALRHRMDIVTIINRIYLQAVDGERPSVWYAKNIKDNY